MKKIVLLCAAGMSTSMLVQKMRQAAASAGYACEINAYAVSTAAESGADADAILLAPQARFKQKDVEKACPNVPVACIDMRAYGMMDGAGVLKQARTLIGN